MGVRIPTVAIVAGALALAVPAQGAPRGCGAVAAGGKRFPVRVVRGAVSCAAAATTLRSYLRESRAPRGWVCALGHYGDPWAAHCATASAFVEARDPADLAVAPTARRGAALTAVASGLRAGTYRLTLVSDVVPARGVRCLADLGGPVRTRGGWATLRGVVPRRLTCVQGATTVAGRVTAAAGRYHLVVGVKVAPGGWSARFSYLRRAIRVR